MEKKHSTKKEVLLDWFQDLSHGDVDLIATFLFDCDRKTADEGSENPTWINNYSVEDPPVLNDYLDNMYTLFFDHVDEQGNKVSYNEDEVRIYLVDLIEFLLKNVEELSSKQIEELDQSILPAIVWNTTEFCFDTDASFDSTSKKLS